MCPTLFGARVLLFYAVVVAAYFAAPYENLFFLLLAFLSVQQLLAFAWSWRSLRGVSVVFDDMQAVMAGAEAMVTATLHAARGRRCDVNVGLRIAATAGLTRKARVSGHIEVLRDRQCVVIQIPPLPRGIHAVERVTLASTWPFGLWRRSLRVAGPREIVVYPQPATMTHTARTGKDAVRELIGASLSGAGDMQPSSLRDRREGDSPRAVHWRASARRGRLVVLEWEGGGGDGLEVVLDRRCEPQQLEDALAELTAIVMLARAGKETLSMRSQGLAMVCGDGHEPWERALRFLAAAQPLDDGAAAPPPTSPAVLRLPRRVNRV